MLEGWLCSSCGDVLIVAGAACIRAPAARAVRRPLPKCYYGALGTGCVVYVPCAESRDTSVCDARGAGVRCTLCRSCGGPHRGSLCLSRARDSRFILFAFFLRVFSVSDDPIAIHSTRLSESHSDFSAHKRSRRAEPNDRRGRRTIDQRPVTRAHRRRAPRRMLSVVVGRGRCVARTGRRRVGTSRARRRSRAAAARGLR